MKKYLLYLLVFSGLLFMAYLAVNFFELEQDFEQTQVTQSNNKTLLPQSSNLLNTDEELKNTEFKDLAALFPVACFAPGTDPAIIEQYYHDQYEVANSLGMTEAEVTTFFNVANRWTFTATDGGGLGQGDFTTLTWSYVDDGTPIPNSCFPGASDPSDVIAFFNGMYGAPTVPGDYTTAPWHQIFVQMFTSWSEISGLQFVYEPNDDGAAIFTSPGQVGVRGDLRISGHELDGNSGILACNTLPENGDMIIDTSDGFFTNNPGSASDPYLGTVNVLTHELGHGLGILHVCPINQTKLMEPFVSLAFEAQQEDDILAVNRLYGDREGDNDSPAGATFLGDNGVSSSFSKSQLSIDDNNEQDYFSVTISQIADINVSLIPTGTTYLDGVQQLTGQCSPGSPFDASIISDLMIEVLDQDGTTVIATADSNGPGGIESLITSITNTGTYFIRVKQQNNVNNVQMYDLEVSLGSCNNTTVPANLLASNITGASALLSWDAQDFALYDLRFRESSTSTWTELNDIVAPNQTLSNLDILTEYEVQVRAKCAGDAPSAYSASYFFTTIGITYCNSEGESVVDEYISNVQFGTIDNSTADENGGYSDFTNISTEVILSQAYPITITPFWTGITYSEGYAVWIDFNQNGNFDDAGELVFSTGPTQNTPVSGIISIPADALLGETRMRVSMKYDGIPDPCEIFDYGEVEDYTVDILNESIGVAENAFGSDFVLYPNPVRNGQFTIKTPNLSGEVDIEITNLVGQQISNHQLSVEGQQVNVSTNNLSTGIYFIRLSQNSQSFTSKFIIE